MDGVIPSEQIVSEKEEISFFVICGNANETFIRVGVRRISVQEVVPGLDFKPVVLNENGNCWPIADLMAVTKGVLIFVKSKNFR